MVRGNRLVLEHVPDLPWRDDHYVHAVVGLRYPHEGISWNDALQYTSVLCQGLTEIEEGSNDASWAGAGVGCLSASPVPRCGAGP